MRWFVRLECDITADVALRHMAAGAVVGRIFVLTNGKRHSATFLRVAGQAFLAEVTREPRSRGLDVRVMAGDAAQPAAAASIALAQNHRKIMLQKIGLRRRIAFRRHDENGECVIERRARSKVALIFAGL